MNRRESLNDDTPKGAGLFLRCIICSFLLLALFSLFALNTDFSNNIKSAFKSAVEEESPMDFIPRTIEAAQEKILSLREKNTSEKAEYTPDQNTKAINEEYPNPIIMPSETQKTNGAYQSSDI